MKRYMKRIMKSIARAMWKRSGAIRRPLIRKFHAKFHVLMHDHVSSMNDHASSIHEHVSHVSRDFHDALELHSARQIQPIIQELNLVLDGVVRELTRLQNQVEMLHLRIEEQSAEATVVPFGTVGEADDFEPYVAGDGECLLAMGSDHHHWNRKSG